MSLAACKGMPPPKELAIFSAVTDAFLSLFTIVGNVTVIYVVYKDPLKKLRNPFMYFVVNLAVADLLVGCIFNPLDVYGHVNEYYRTITDQFMRVIHMSFFISVTASILSLIALTVDRYITIRYPFKYKEYLTLRRCQIAIGVIWLLSITIPIGYFETGFIEYLMYDVFICVALALIIFVITYVQLNQSLRKQTMVLAERKESKAEQEKFQLKRMKREQKITRVFLTMLIMFLCMYGPAAIMILILKFCPDCDCYVRHWLRDITSILIAVNSLINPLVYTARLGAFRKSLKILFRRVSGDNMKKGSISSRSQRSSTTSTTF